MDQQGIFNALFGGGSGGDRSWWENIPQVALGQGIWRGAGALGNLLQGLLPNNQQSPQGHVTLGPNAGVTFAPGYNPGVGGIERGFAGLGGGGFNPLSGAGVGSIGMGGSLGPASGWYGGAGTANPFMRMFLTRDHPRASQGAGYQYGTSEVKRPEEAGLPPGLARLQAAGRGPYQPGGPKSTDTVNAKLTPGEGVLNTGAMALPGMRPAVDAANMAGLDLPSWAGALAGGLSDPTRRVAGPVPYLNLPQAQQIYPKSPYAEAGVPRLNEIMYPRNK